MTETWAWSLKKILIFVLNNIALLENSNVWKILEKAVWFGERTGLISHIQRFLLLENIYKFLDSEC
jgi:hypothetical protein